ALEGGNADGAAVKDAGREGGIDLRLLKGCLEMRHASGAPGSYQRHLAQRSHTSQLLEVVTVPRAVGGHAVEHNLTRAALLDLADPAEGLTLAIAAARRIAGVLIHAIALRGGLAVDPHDDALAAEAFGQPVDELRVGECWGVHGDLLGALIEHRFRVLHRADAAGDAERDVQNARDAAHPAAIHGTLLGTGSDVVEHQLIGALVAVARRQIQNVPDHAVITEAHALDDLAVAHVQAGNYAFGKNGRSSCNGMRSSNRALPLMAAGTPMAASATRSAPLATPPEACQRMAGNRASA